MDSGNYHFKLPETIWPIAWGKEQGLYFYLEAIEELRGGRVLVKDRGEMIMLSSYSYLGLLGHPTIEAAAVQAVQRYGTGAHGVRLLAGTLPLHEELETKIAQFKKTEAAVVYSSGYLANLSAISAVVSRDDLVFCDKLDHVSIRDGCQLSGAGCIRFRHNEMAHLEDCLRKADPKKKKLVVVDAVFSMDGDIANLPEISRLCRQYGALLMVDEAHSLGVLGADGRGIDEYFGLAPDTIDVKMGTLSKTIPAMGGYIAGCSELINLLKHNSRGFIFSAALAPPLAAAALASFDLILREPGRICRLQANMRHFRDRLREKGFNLLNTETPIMPVICGDDQKAWRMAKYCQDEGLFVHGIPSPVVPRGRARLRAIVTAAHTDADIGYCLEVIEKAGRLAGII
ncbi:aminotransferase class I/II-fold pyridoxal phosphate-dependent enzyme [Gaoshiqia sp. Z1-71]|uniref:aminotransferase class I/II-fold pyridoxal phosphate-dependent enzyme n=1 Tax=Gaoshiqia hydrogeniformans TaxID=3290090 RepID=UPI003BF77372